MNLKEELIKYLDAGYPILIINSYEEIKTDRIIREAVGNRKIIEWNGASGRCNFETKLPLISQDYDEIQSLPETLKSLLNNKQEIDKRLLILKDVTDYLDNVEIIALLKRICHKIENGLDAAIIIVTSVIKIPKELEKFITILETDPLSEDEIRKQIESFSEETHNVITPELLDKMSLAFKGLTEFEIENLLASAISTDGMFTSDSLKLIFEQKRQMIMKSNILEMIRVTEKIEDIGGLENLKKFLVRKSRVYKSINKAREFGVDMPKGIMITGVPGCGKSLTAKVTSYLFEVPLLKLDLGKIMGKYYGESEKNMREAIKLAEAISPCVLWIDELEKAFGGATGSGHEVTIRLLGTFLTWMQEKTSPVFVVATANNISGLPPEMLRKGRFDEIFYVDLPEKEEREKIFEIHIGKRRSQDLPALKKDIKSFAEKSKGFSGSEIESTVVSAIENAFGDAMDNNQDLSKQSLTSKHITDIIKVTKPLSKISEDELNKLRDYYTEHQFNNASKNDNKKG